MLKNKMQTRMTAMLCVLIAVVCLLADACSNNVNKTKASLRSSYSETTNAVMTNVNYDWSQGIPSWEELDLMNQDLSRRTIGGFIKGIVTGDLTVNIQDGTVHEDLIDQKLRAKEELQINAYKVRLTCIYRNGDFYALRPETNDEYMRTTITDCILAKKAGMAVFLEVDFRPGQGFKDENDLIQALEMWQLPISNMSMYAERYNIDYLDVFGGLNNALNDKTLALSNERKLSIYNEYHNRLVQSARADYTGKLVSQIEDNGTVISQEQLDYDYSGSDILGLRTQRSLAKMNAENYKDEIDASFAGINGLSKKYNIPWMISEVRLSDDKPADRQKETRQAEVLASLFERIDALEGTQGSGPLGVFVDSWDADAEKTFYSIKGRPAQTIVAGYFATKD